MSTQLSADCSKMRPEVSVIIPTYNRYDSLLKTLDSLSIQTLAPSRFEVIVVDDGSTDGTSRLASSSHPFNLRCVVQQNLGAAVARNRGAEISRGKVLVFIDDDIALDPGYLQAISATHCGGQTLVSMGVFLPYLTGQDSTFATLYPRVIPTQGVNRVDHFVSFVECTSNNLAIERQHFFDVGMWHDVLGDGPTLWGDVDFGYRAWKQGFQFLKVSNAQLYHRDHAIVDLQSACKRAYHSSRTVHLLFQRHPEIARYLSTFWDKHPMSIFRDPPSLIARKVFRIITASLPALWTMKHMVQFMEATAPKSFLLVLLYRWMISAHMYEGYRLGLRELADTKREASYQLSPSK